MLLLVLLYDPLLAKPTLIRLIPIKLHALALGIGSILTALVVALIFLLILRLTLILLHAGAFYRILNKSLLLCEVGTASDTIQLLLGV